jgi:hypothetical protein
MSNPYLIQLERAQEEAEYWRNRAEAAEEALRGGSTEPGVWMELVYPLTLFQTRVMRLLARRGMSSVGLLQVLQNDYPNTSDGAIKAQLTAIRHVLPAQIAPVRGKPYPGCFHIHYVPDPEALKAFLVTGQLPMRAAA